MSLRSGATRGPRAVDAMAGGARALAFEQRPAARRVADRDGRAVGSNPARMNAMTPVSSAGCSANGGMPAPGTPLVITRARSSSDDGAAELAAAQVDPGHLSPFGAVALRALGAVDARTRVDVRLGVLARVILRPDLRTDRRNQQRGRKGRRRRHERHRCVHVATLYPRRGRVSSTGLCS